MVSLGELELYGLIAVLYEEKAGEFTALDDEVRVGASWAVEVDFSPVEERAEPDGFIELAYRKLGAEGRLDVWGVLHGECDGIQGQADAWVRRRIQISPICSPTRRSTWSSVISQIAKASTTSPGMTR